MLSLIFISSIIIISSIPSSHSVFYPLMNELTKSTTRSKCLKPLSISTPGSISLIKCRWLNGIRIQFKPRLAKNLASASIKKYSSHLSKKNS